MHSIIVLRCGKPAGNANTPFTEDHFLESDLNEAAVRRTRSRVADRAVGALI